MERTRLRISYILLKEENDSLNNIVRSYFFYKMNNEDSTRITEE